mmetsp:Transcript_10808/g.31304  ORF Transcript_10808/g.31304 Transcript_10808/m.31304 type:complete len:247 (-) Transcript_10808:1568-2308(-)
MCVKVWSISPLMYACTVLHVCIVCVHPCRSINHNIHMHALVCNHVCVCVCVFRSRREDRTTSVCPSLQSVVDATWTPTAEQIEHARTGILAWVYHHPLRHSQENKYKKMKEEEMIDKHRRMEQEMDDSHPLSSPYKKHSHKAKKDSGRSKHSQQEVDKPGHAAEGTEREEERGEGGQGDRAHADAHEDDGHTPARKKVGTAPHRTAPHAPAGGCTTPVSSREGEQPPHPTTSLPFTVCFCVQHRGQ